MTIDELERTLALLNVPPDTEIRIGWPNNEDSFRHAGVRDVRVLEHTRIRGVELEGVLILAGDS